MYGKAFVWTVLAGCILLPTVGTFWPNGYKYVGVEPLTLQEVLSGPHAQIIWNSLVSGAISAVIVAAIFAVCLPAMLNVKNQGIIAVCSSLLLCLFFVSPMVRGFYFGDWVELLHLNGQPNDFVVRTLWSTTYFGTFYLVTVLGLWSGKEFAHSNFALSELQRPWERVYSLKRLLFAPLISAFICTLSFSIFLGPEADRFNRNYYTIGGELSRLYGQYESQVLVLSGLILVFSSSLVLLLGWAWRLSSSWSRAEAP